MPGRSVLKEAMPASANRQNVPHLIADVSKTIRVLRQISGAETKGKASRLSLFGIVGACSSGGCFIYENFSYAIDGKLQGGYN